MPLSNVFVSVKSLNSELLNSGIAAMTPNIFPVFLFGYTHPFHKNGC